MRWLIPWILLPWLLLPATAAAQAPSTDIHVLPLTRGEEGTVTVGAPWNASTHPGYDNQPAFLPASDAFLFTSQRLGEQTEVFRLELADRSVQRVTSTPESEYSPTPLPSGGFSTVRVETDTTGTQRLWEFDAEGKNPRLVLPEVRGIGYHVWANQSELFLFVLGEPHELHHADRRTGVATLVTKDIGRALHRIPGQNAITFTQPLTEETWAIRRLDVATREITPLADAVGTSQDLTWTPDGALWMIDGTRLVELQGGAWVELADLGAMGLSDLTRLAVSPDGRWLAVVASEPAAAVDGD